ncbi:MAG: tRNA (adenosine(37)-N6)-dimethylallyltransferase MiaA, partial [Amphiplicatus sp.]
MTESFSANAAFIAGPTASGKSAAALMLAERLGGEIVNADALQVYADLDILSARPTPEEMGAVSHHLFGFLDGAERGSAGRWAREAARIIGEIEARGRIALVVGGTGLYFKALEDGLSPIPAIPDEAREEARATLEKLGAEAFRNELIARDPGAARIAPADRQRLTRSWEVLAATGRSFSAFQAEARAPLIGQARAKVVINPDRDALYAACDARFDRMLARGGLEEARRLMARNLPDHLPVMKALGAAEL